MLFISKTVVNVRNRPSLSGALVGQIGGGQELSTEGEAVTADGYVWWAVSDSGGNLWVAERSVDGATVLLVSKEPIAAKTQPASSTPTSASQASSTTKVEIAALPANVDIDPNDYYRTFRAALNITRAFEGGGFGSYNNYDRGIVSYGIVQFTLSSGSLVKVLELYLANSTSEAANALRNEYGARFRSKDQALRNDTRFRDLLKAAAQETPMQDAQYKVAVTDYWEVVIKNYIANRGGMRLPLTYALLFDMGINFGVGHGYVRKAETELGVQPVSRPGANGITEQQLTTKVAELRRDSHYAQAARDNLPGLRVRGDFWVNLAHSGDWFLQGDDKGLVYPKGGVSVQVLKPF